MSSRSVLSQSFNKALVVSDCDLNTKKLVFDIESFGYQVSVLTKDDLIQNDLSNETFVMVFFLCSEDKTTEEYASAITFLKQLFSSSKLIALQKTFNIEKRLVAYKFNVKDYLLLSYDRFQLEQVIHDVFQTSSPQAFNALIIDNHAEPCQHILTLLKENGFKVKLLADPFSLNEAVQVFDCDLVFLRLEGSNFCCDYLRVIKDIEHIRGISLIVLSEKKSCANETVCLSENADADACLSFPYNDSELLRVANIHARRSQATKQSIRRFNVHYYEREREHKALDAHALVSTTDVYGRITYVNDNFCHTSGYTNLELLGQNHRLIKSDIHSPDFYRNMWLTISNGEIWKGEICNKRKDGSYYWVESTITTFLDEKGKPYQYISVRTDITQKKQTEIALRKAIDILEKTNQAARIGSWEFNPLNSELLWSKVTKEIHGVPELYQPTVETALSFYSKGDHQDRISFLFDRAINKGIGFDDEFLITTADDEDCWARVIGISEFENEKCTRVYGLFQDITDKKSTLLSLLHAKEAAEIANVAKSAFISQMSHELRTPLNAILGFAQLLQEASGLVKEEQEDVYEIIKAGKHLLGLINQILDLSAVESGKLNLSFETINILEILNESLQLISPLILHKKINIITDIENDIFIKVDRFRFKQILLNLLSNAVKYNIEKGSVIIKAIHSSNDRIKILIEDTGSGIPEEKLEQLFRPFNRLGKEKEAIEGTGVGLTISKSLADLMGGKLEYEKTRSMGACFCLEFSKAGKAYAREYYGELPSKSEYPKKGIKKQKNILYVEGNPANVKLIAHILSSRDGVNLLTAFSPSVGIKIALESEIDLVMLDINLPEMSGFELLETLKRYPKFAKVPFIAISANAMKEDVVRGLNSDFSYYLTKPINIKQFNQVIDELL